MKRKTAHSRLHKKKHHKPKVMYFGWRIVSFVAITLVLGALLVFVPSKFSDTNLCANSISCISDLSGNYEETSEGEFEGEKVAVPPLAGKPALAQTPNLIKSTVLGDTSADNKRIYVDLSRQKLSAFEGNTLVYEFDVSTGKPWWATPTGDFRIWIKLRYTRMKGGSRQLGTYYDLPNVPYTMYFYNDQIPKHRGYGIHGAYWHNNFGHPMSHGCVNMREEDVAKLYHWANPATGGHTTNASAENPGTLITIFGKTPGS